MLNELEYGFGHHTCTDFAIAAIPIECTCDLVFVYNLPVEYSIVYISPALTLNFKTSADALTFVISTYDQAYEPRKELITRIGYRLGKACHLVIISSDGA